MRDYIIRRLLLMIPTVAIVLVVIFLLFRFITLDLWGISLDEPGNYYITSSFGGPTTQDIREALGLNLPLPVAFGRWIAGIFTRGDFGTSLWTGRSVTAEILRGLPITFELGLIGFILAVAMALPMGIISAIRQDRGIGHLSRSVSILGISMPGFWLATLIIVFPAVWWGWHPPTRFIPFFEDPLGNLQQFLLPGAILGFAMAGVTVRYLRTTLLEVMRRDYIRTAWAKGLNERVVVMRHALKNAFIPVITILFGQAFVMFGGVLIMEVIFDLPGVGRLLLKSVFMRDYPYAQGIALISAFIGLLFILANDLSYAYSDPRIRHKY